MSNVTNRNGKNRFSKRNAILAAAVAGALGGGLARAADISWGTATTIAGEGDVLTAGTLKYAYDWSGTSATVNGVAFVGSTSMAGAGTDVVFSANFASGGHGQATDLGSTAAPFASLSSSYQTILSSSVANWNAVPPTVTATLNGLTIGNQYETQYWANDSCSLMGLNPQTLQSGANSVQVAVNSDGENEGSLGQWVIGVFTADSTSQTFNFTGTAATQINALQLRDFGEFFEGADWKNAASGDISDSANYTLPPAGQSLRFFNQSVTPCLPA